MRAVTDFLVLFSVFVKQKVTITQNIIFTDPVSGIQPPDCSKLARNPKNDNEVIIFRRCCFVSLIKFSYWSRFHVNIITGSGTMTIFFVRDGLDIPKSKIPPSEFCPISGDWGQLWIPNLPRMCLIIECY